MVGVADVPQVAGHPVVQVEEVLPLPLFEEDLLRLGWDLDRLDRNPECSRLH